MSFGNAFGAFVPRRGGGSGPSTPAFAPRYVVGNATNGDTTADCDFLDPGDGTGIRNAVAAATAVPGDIWIRPGVYNFISSQLGTMSVFAGVRIWGAGPSTILIPPASFNATLFDLATDLGAVPGYVGVELAWMTIRSSGFSGLTSNEPAIVTVRGTNARNSSIHHVTFEQDGGVFDIPFRAVQVGFGTGGFAVRECDFEYASPRNTGNPDSGLVAVYSANAGSNPALPVVVESCGFSGFDYQLACQGHNPLYRNTEHVLSGVNQGAAVLLSTIGRNPSVIGANITLQSCAASRGILSSSQPGGFGQPGFCTGAIIQGCQLFDADGPAAGNTGVEIQGPVGAGLPNWTALIAGNSVAGFDRDVALIDTRNCLVLGNVLVNTSVHVFDNTAPNSLNELAHNIEA